MPIASELLWWPLVFFSFQLIYSVYGFIYLRHAVYLVILFHAIYILFLKFAIWLPSSSFWTMQETYTNVLGRDFIYLLKSSIFLWGCALLPIKMVGISDGKKSRYLFLVALMIFSLLDMTLLNPNNNTSGLQRAPSANMRNLKKIQKKCKFYLTHFFAKKMIFTHQHSEV